MAYFPGTYVIPADNCKAVVHFRLDYNDPAGTYYVPIRKGTFVHNVGTFVKTAFTTSGSNASLTVGDSAGAANYMAANDVVLETIDTVTTLASGAGETNATGKYYAADDYVRFVFTPASAGATAGTVVGFVLISNGYVADAIPA